MSSLLGKNIIQTTYGFEVQSPQDEVRVSQPNFIMTSDAFHSILRCLKRLITTFREPSSLVPFWSTFSPSVSNHLGCGVPSCIDFVCVVKYLPSWFPGAGFRKHAVISRTRAWKMSEEPYDYVKKAFVRFYPKPLECDLSNIGCLAS